MSDFYEKLWRDCFVAAIGGLSTDRDLDLRSIARHARVVADDAVGVAKARHNERASAKTEPPDTEGPVSR